MLYTNTDKSISASTTGVKKIMKVPLWGIFKWWVFWIGNFLIVLLFTLGLLWAIGCFILERCYSPL
ncbi:MAG: hypothetical protein ACD_37C00683G0005 [uncultured bacterium]|nr:MAG: hypothetical protein ACD_37C00683G0005 [uncultured bacterium]